MQSEFPKNLLFVDFDGCLTSRKDNTFFNPNPSQYHASEPILDSLKRFCLQNEAKIVISSNWRKFDPDGIWKADGHEFANPIGRFKSQLGDLFFDMLPAIRHVKKSEALIHWFQNHLDFFGGYAIFDDDLEEDYQHVDFRNINKHFIYVDSYVGITENDLEKAKMMLV